MIVLRTNIRRLVCLLIALSVCAGFLGGCKNQEPPWEASIPPVATPVPPVTNPVPPGKGDDDFTLLMDELFSQWVTADALTMNFFLADPESLGIERPTPTFGEVANPDTIKRDIQDNIELYDKLKRFRYEDLSLDQQNVYDILIRDLELISIMERRETYAYYSGYIRPIDGIQAQLPILLAEFNFRTVADIEIYLQLLEDTQRFFNEIIEFERERSRLGFFLSEYNADIVIENCESFLSNRHDNLLIVVFNDRMDRYEGLSEARRDEFKLQNRNLVLGNVLPAYDALLSAMRELRGIGAHQGGLSDFPDGSEYAAAYLQYKTGSDRSPEGVDALLDEWMDSTLANMISIINKNPEYLKMSESGDIGQIADDTPEAYLAKLQKAIATDFPGITETRHVVREVHESLREYVSPAFYLSPAIDCFDDNVIYINPPKTTDNLSLFTILAHEGYPGHMYQTVYTLQHSPHPIRVSLENMGYDEGWATYAEMMSYSYAGLPEVEAELLRASKIYDLLLMGRIDLGVNALGWGIGEITSFCAGIGIDDQVVIGELYETVIGNPLLYMPYILGFIEISLLLEEAENTMHINFYLKEFHRFILDFGSAPFTIIRERMLGWMALVCAPEG